MGQDLGFGLGIEPRISSNPRVARALQNTRVMVRCLVWSVHASPPATVSSLAGFVASARGHVGAVVNSGWCDTVIPIPRVYLHRSGMPGFRALDQLRPALRVPVERLAGLAAIAL